MSMEGAIALVDDAAAPMPLYESFDTFYRREFAAMVALAYSVSGSAAAAEDLAQEALIRAHRVWPHVSTYEKPGAWVRRVTINLATSGLRRRAAEARALLRIGRPAEPLPPPEPEDEAVWAAVRRLPPQQRAAVALYYLEDRSVADIAAILECSESTAKVHLHRGRQTLHARLAERQNDGS